MVELLPQGEAIGMFTKQDWPPIASAKVAVPKEVAVPETTYKSVSLPVLKTPGLSVAVSPNTPVEDIL
jgi:hypothetical protein